ncbi:MAG TPA: sugar transferase [Lachnospiraceae bacterium]|nr:sugar transferase [Lachnospiraceae bacterium]
MYRRRSGLQNVLILLSDTVVIIISLFIATLLREGSIVDSSLGRLRFVLNLAPMLFFFVAANLLLNNNRDFYIRGYLLELMHVIWNNIIMLSGTSVVLFFIRYYDIFSRLTILYFFIMDCALMWVTHIILKRVIPGLYMRLLQEKNVLLIGSRDFIDTYLSDYDHARNFSDVVIGAVIPGDTAQAGQELQIGFHKITVRADLEGLSEYCKSASVDEIVVGMEGRKSELLPVLDELSVSGISISYQIDIPKLSGCKHRMYSGTEHIDMIVYANQVVSVGYLIIKRLMDIIGGIIGCIAFLVLFVIFGPLIRLESEGPVLFKQKRVGRNGRIFNIYKFRSMYKDAEERKKELLSQNELNGPVFKLENDPRITKVGGFLRRTSLDEFPQFINVLKGDMSLVGTRPPTLDEFSRYSLGQKKRLSFRPGLTGLWQVSGRNDITDFEEIVALDIEYIDNWSIILDLKILFKTIPAMFSGK